MVTPDAVAQAEALVAARAREALEVRAGREEALRGCLLEVVGHVRAIDQTPDVAERAARATGLLAAAAEAALEAVACWAEWVDVEPPEALDDLLADAGELCDWAEGLTGSLRAEQERGERGGGAGR